MSTGASTPAGRRRAAARATTAPRATTKPRATRVAAKPEAPPRRPRPKAPRRAPAQSSLALPRFSLPSFSLPALRLPSLSFGWVRGLGHRRSLLIAALIAAALFAGYYGWLRNSSLVAAKHVTVDGITTPDGDRIEAALAEAGKGMSTLDVDEARLQAAVAAFPTVASVSADGNFPSGLTIHVTERPPAMIASDGDNEVPVAADGTILTGIQLAKDQAAGLPVLHVKSLKPSGRLGGSPLAKATVLGATPEPLRPLVNGVHVEKGTGVVVTMEGGFRIEFGSSADAATKWGSAAAVLADPKLDSLAYVDVRIPGRPAVGGS